MRRASAKAFAFLLLAVSGAARADLDFSLAAETRAFTAQDRGDASLAAQLNYTSNLRPGEILALEAFARADAREDARSKADLRAAYYQALSGPYSARLGVARVFWGVTESRHLVDVVNQSNLAEDLSGGAKLGQPMIELAYNEEGVSFAGYLLPGFRTQRLPGKGGVIRYPFPLALDETRIEARGGELHLDFAARAAWSAEGIDLAASWFDGIARAPRILPCFARGSGLPNSETRANCVLGDAVGLAPQPNALTAALQALGLAPSNEQIAADITQRVLANLVLVPSYERQRQIGVEAQWVIDAFAAKGEALVRERLGQRSAAAVLGLEYNFGGPGGSDLTAIAEWLRDTAPDALEGSRYEHEVFVGGRCALNDVGSSAALFGALLDTGGNGQVYTLEFSRRLGDAVKAGFKARVFTGGDKQNIANVLRDADELRFTLERFF